MSVRSAVTSFPSIHLVSCCALIRHLTFCLIQVRTGEEEETVLYSHRSRLYRLRQAEWKERGTGDMKLLKDHQGRVRLLMRREPVMKVKYFILWSTFYL